MKKDVKDFQLYPSQNQKDFIKSTFNKMIQLIPQFSKLQAEQGKLSFTEYSMLYRDLFEFYNVELMTRNSYKVKDIISFRNSFELIYRRLKDVANVEHIYLQVWFRDKLEAFESWVDEITWIATKELDRS
ncbi:MAG: hypothetical protein SVR94_02990 [Pseudomonadota bacterium]|nr:hypothetical protein [Pseudomonadota bacterium]